jgi:hypothetical protein
MSTASTRTVSAPRWMLWTGGFLSVGVVAQEQGPLGGREGAPAHVAPPRAHPHGLIIAPGAGRSTRNLLSGRAVFYGRRAPLSAHPFQQRPARIGVSGLIPSDGHDITESTT